MKKIILLMIVLLMVGLVDGLDRSDDTVVFNIITNTPSRANDIVVFNPSGADSCTYSGSGEWEIDCSENCETTINTDVLGNNISVTNSGSINISHNITNYDEFHVSGTNSTDRCEVHFR